MADDTTDTDGSEYRPTDYLAMCGLAYGVGVDRDAAVLNALRHASSFDDDTVEVAVWELYADSWQSHSPRGPERSAEQVSYEEWTLPVEYAEQAADHATTAFGKLSWAFDEGERTHEEGKPA